VPQKDASSTEKLALLTPNLPLNHPHEKKQKNSARAFALRIALALALISISAILLASSLTSSTGAAGGSQQPNVATAALALGKVTPVVFNGDVRNLPQVPQRELEERELEEPFDYKQLLPEVVTAKRQNQTWFESHPCHYFTSKRWRRCAVCLEEVER